MIGVSQDAQALTRLRKQQVLIAERLYSNQNQGNRQPSNKGGGFNDTNATLFSGNGLNYDIAVKLLPMGVVPDGGFKQTILMYNAKNRAETILT